jgi:TRAP-type C4-dicarboxylate transport system substrate-binding protein
MFGKKRFFPLLLVFSALCFFGLSPSALFGQRQRGLTVTLASSLPRNSPWGRTLDRIAYEWGQVTKGEVTLRILHQYPGSEGEYLMKLRQDKIQAAILTSVAFTSVAPEIMALSIPFLIRNNAELDAVLDQVRPELNARIEQEGYITLAWVKAGWIKVFSRSPVFTPADLRKLKLGTSPDEEELMDAFRTMGFQMVRVTYSDIAQRLNSGMIDAVYMNPVAVSAFRLHTIVRNMSTINLAPFMGGILMSRNAWNRIPQAYRAQLMEITTQAGREFETSFQQSEEDAVTQMTREGLKLSQVGPAQEQLWYQEIYQHIPDLVNRNVFHRGMYERIQGILQKYRGER